MEGADIGFNGLASGILCGDIYSDAPTADLVRTFRFILLCLVHHKMVGDFGLLGERNASTLSSDTDGVTGNVRRSPYSLCVTRKHSQGQ